MIKSLLLGVRKSICNSSKRFIRNMADGTVRIGTHDGTFHCDEALACFLLKILPEYKHAEIIRTRNQKILDDCDVVVDVGGCYDPSSHRYDHHQRSFKHTMNSLNSEYEWKIKLSSAGLVYFHHGHNILSEILKLDKNDVKIKALFKKMYENFIQEIDAIDNGISVCDKPRYVISTNISSRVKGLNPNWDDKNTDIDGCFKKAMSLAGKDFMDFLSYYSDSWWPARKLVENALKERYNTYSSGEIVEFEKGSCPWVDHLLCLEEELSITPTIKFVIYKDEKGNYRVQCVPVEAGSFENRLSLIEEWRGLRDEELSKISGIDGCIFVHSTGFIGGNKTRKGALLMAINTLKSVQTELH